MVLQEMEDVSEAVPQLRRAAHFAQRAEGVRVGDALAADVGQQVRIQRLGQDDLRVVGVEVYLDRRRKIEVRHPAKMKHIVWWNTFRKRDALGLCSMSILTKANRNWSLIFIYNNKKVCTQLECHAVSLLAYNVAVTPPRKA